MLHARRKGNEVVKHAFDLEIRVLIEQPIDGIFRASCLETDHCLTTTDGWQFTVEILHNVIEQECQSGRQRFRDAPDWLAAIWTKAGEDEELAERFGIAYRARWRG